MKKLFWIVAALAVTFASCQELPPVNEPESEKTQEEEDPGLPPVDDTQGGPSVINAEIPASVPTRVSLTAGEAPGLALAWQAGDCLRINGEVFSIVEEGMTSSKAGFSGKSLTGDSFTVIYPGTFESEAAWKSRSYVGQVQDGNGSTSHLNWNAKVSGLSSYNSIVFAEKEGQDFVQNGVIKFAFALPERFSSLETISITLPEAIIPSTNDPQGEKVASLSIGLQNLGLTEENREVVAYMMVSPEEIALEPESVYTITLVGPAGYSEDIEKTVGEEGLSFGGGSVTILSLDASDLKEPIFWGGSGTQEDPYQIKTWKNLKNIILEDYNLSTVYFKLVDDIALTDQQAADFAELNNFKGHLDGDNHSITGLTTPLFGNLNGWVSNLDITANVSFDTSDERMASNNYGVGLLAHYIYNTNGENTVENVTVRGSLSVSGVTLTNAFLIGGLAGASNGVPVTGCKNFASVTVDGLSTGDKVIRVGGLIGALQSSNRASCTDCENNGAITVHSVTTSGEVSVGGLFGHAGQPVTLDNCDNKSTGTVLADYNCSSVAIAMVAGIIASSGSEPIIKNCDNDATVTNSIVAANAFRTAGIISSYTTTSTKSRLVHNCTNNAAILENSPFATKKYHYVAGIVGYSDGGAPAADYSTTSLSITECVNNGTVTCAASSSNVLAVGGIIARSAHYPYIYNCENKQAVSSSAPATSMYMAGVLGWVDKGAHVVGCINRGTVTNTGAVSDYMRVGGVIGNFSCAKDNSSSVLPFGTVENSKNYGVVSNQSASGAKGSGATNGAYVGGVFGGSASGTTYVINCENHGDVSNAVTEGATTVSMNLGGIAGYMGNADGKIDGCTSNCTISTSGTVTTYMSAQVLGRCGTGGTFTISNTHLAGTVDGTAIDADNYSSFICGYKSGAISDIETCSFYNVP